MPENESLERLRSAVAAFETEKRYRHTLGVETEAAALATVLLPEKTDKLRAAALLHDLTKCRNDEEQIALAKELNVPLTKELLSSPQVLHGLTAVKLIPQLFPEYACHEILHAISVHTTGAADMSLFDKILFVADYTEPGRTQSICRATRAEMWELLKTATDKYRAFDTIVCKILADTIQYLRENHQPVVSATEDAYCFLTHRLNDE